MRRAFEGDEGYAVLLLTVAFYSSDEPLTIERGIFELDIVAYLIYEDVVILLDIEQ